MTDMKRITVQEQEAGQRLNKLLSRYLREAPQSFLYRMLRKKNIILNGRKAGGSEKVQTGDEICIFLSDETYEKFSGQKKRKKQNYPVTDLDIIYEDEHFLLINKPAGMLTQKASPEDISLNEYMLGYLERSGQWSQEQPFGSDETGKADYAFRPSVCNRLDRNTSGIVVCGKTLAGLQKMSELLRERSMHKDYQCLVAGTLTDSRRIRGYLWKDSAANRVRIYGKEQPGTALIETEYHPLKVFADSTLLAVRLITGRSHQIRAHLASEGHPIIGDYKYGKQSVNIQYKKQYGVSGQLLHAYRLQLPALEAPFGAVSGRTFEAKLPAVMKRIIEEKEKDR